MLAGKLDTDEKLLATELELLATLELLFTLDEIEATLLELLLTLLELLFTLAVTLLDDEGKILAAILLDDEDTTTRLLLELATIELLKVSWLALALEIELAIDAIELLLLDDTLELLNALLLLAVLRGAVLAPLPPHAVNMDALMKATKVIFLYTIINLKLLELTKHKVDQGCKKNGPNRPIFLFAIQTT